MKSRATSQRGLTLIELIVTISVASILLAIGVPGLRTLILANARSEASSNLYIALSQARSEAIARNRTVVVCAKDAGASSPACLASAADWKDGWLIYVEQAAGVAPTADDVLGSFKAVNAAIEVLPNDGSTAAIAFRASGRSAQATQFEICETENRVQGRAVRVALAGRITLSKEAGACS